MKSLVIKINLILALVAIVIMGGVNCVRADEINSTENVATIQSTNGTSTTNEEVKSYEDNGKSVGMIAAALAIGLASIGSGIAVAVVASSAVGAISENPGLLGKAVIFAGLAEGIAIYGLIIAIMILSKI